MSLKSGFLTNKKSMQFMVAVLCEMNAIEAYNGLR